MRSDEKPSLEIRMPTGKGQGVGSLSPKNEVESGRDTIQTWNMSYRNYVRADSM